MSSPEVSGSETKKSLKRRRDSREPPASKRSQKRKRVGTRRANVEDIDEERGINLALGRMNPDLLADYVARKTQRFEDKATLVELEDRRIPVGAFADTTGWDSPRSLDNFPDFLEHFSKEGGPHDLRTAPKQNGTPHTIVVTAAGLRAADITRSLRTFQSKDCIIAKLFAKHIKLKESIDLLKKKRVNIGVGTPSRLIDLLESRINGGHTDALKVDKLERIVVDMSHVDQKKRGILDMKETQKPLIDLLNRDELKPRFGSESEAIQLLLF
ncbi:MAG: hypothetical protein LQ340_000992 [Diploschistes diacapsis]|nr:MAG: hypothetical protein LQ340_000992 [Diploschistes diacapsis]